MPEPSATTSKRLIWDEIGKKEYETGVSKGVLYPIQSNGAYSKGVAWNGLTGVSDSPSGAESNKKYADNIAYLNLISAEECKGTIKAYSYPTEFSECDGLAKLADGAYAGQQSRKKFCLSYVTKKGNDVAGDDYGYKIHLIYSAQAAPSSKEYTTINDSPEPIELSWEFSTTPVPVTTKINGETLKPTAHITIDSTIVKPAALTKIEDILYGKDSTEPRMIMPDELYTILTTG